MYGAAEIRYAVRGGGSLRPWPSAPFSSCGRLQKMLRTLARLRGWRNVSFLFPRLSSDHSDAKTRSGLCQAVKSPGWAGRAALPPEGSAIFPCSSLAARGGGRRGHFAQTVLAPHLTCAVEACSRGEVKGGSEEPRGGGRERKAVTLCFLPPSLKRRSGRGAPKPLWAMRRYMREAVWSILLAAWKPGALPALPWMIPPPSRHACSCLRRASAQHLLGRDGGQVSRSGGAELGPGRGEVRGRAAEPGVPSGCPGRCSALRVPGGLEGRPTPGGREAGGSCAGSSMA